MKEIRQVLITQTHKQELKASLEAPIGLLSSQMKRLSLKEKKFSCFEAASQEEVDKMWDKCQLIDKQLNVRNIINLILDKCCVENTKSCLIFFFFQ